MLRFKAIAELAFDGTIIYVPMFPAVQRWFI
jgi:hypothetical protein